METLSINDDWYKKKGKPQKVLILGSGMAGMAAGIELIKLGHNVKIIEGKPHAGGRVETYRLPNSGLYANLGASRFPKDHEWTMKYIKKYNLQICPFYPNEGKYLHVFRGVKLPYLKDRLQDLKSYPVDLTKEELSMGWKGIFSYPFKKLIPIVYSGKSWPPLAE